MSIPVFGLADTASDCKLRCLQLQDDGIETQVVDFRINRKVVAASSKYFANLLTNRNFVESGQDVIEIREVDCRAMGWILRAIHQLSEKNKSILSKPGRIISKLPLPVWPSVSYPRYEALSAPFRAPFMTLPTVKASFEETMATMQEAIDLIDYLVITDNTEILAHCFSEEFSVKAVLERNWRKVPLGMARELGDKKSFRQFTRLMVYDGLEIGDPESDGWDHKQQPVMLTRICQDIRRGLIQRTKLSILNRHSQLKTPRELDLRCRRGAYYTPTYPGMPLPTITTTTNSQRHPYFYLPKSRLPVPIRLRKLYRARCPASNRLTEGQTLESLCASFSSIEQHVSSPSSSFPPEASISSMIHGYENLIRTFDTHRRRYRLCAICSAHRISLLRSWRGDLATYFCGLQLDWLDTRGAPTTTEPTWEPSHGYKPIYHFVRYNEPDAPAKLLGLPTRAIGWVDAHTEIDKAEREGLLRWIAETHQSHPHRWDTSPRQSDMGRIRVHTASSVGDRYASTTGYERSEIFVSATYAAGAACRWFEELMPLEVSDESHVWLTSSCGRLSFWAVEMIRRYPWARLCREKEKAFGADDGVDDLEEEQDETERGI